MKLEKFNNKALVSIHHKLILFKDIFFKNNLPPNHCRCPLRIDKLMLAKLSQKFIQSPLPPSPINPTQCPYLTDEDNEVWPETKR